jgi:hypothetical protein
VAGDTDEWIDVEPPQAADGEAAPDDDITTGSVANGSDDEWEDVASPEPTAQAAASGGDDEWEDVPAPGGEWSQSGAAAAHVAKGAAPGVGGMAAGLYAGAATTAATAPVLGPAAPVAGVVAGLGVGLGAGALINVAQDKFLALMGWDKPLEEAKKQWPRTTDLAETIPSVALLKPSGALIERGVGAAIGAGAEGAMQLAHGEFDPVKIGMAAGVGAAFPTANTAGSKVLAAGDQLGTRLSDKLYRGEGGRYRGGNKNPDLKEIPAEDPAVAKATEAPQEDEITVANDEPNVAAGVAVEQQAAPVIEGAGNPEGAPMAARVAARPNEPARNYSKTEIEINGVRNPELERATDSKVIDTEPLKGDIKAALSQEGEQVPHTDGTDVLPEGAAPTNPRFRPLADEHADDVMRAESEGIRRAEENGRQGQEGEAFRDLPQKEAPDVVPADQPVPQAKEVPEALSPEDAKRLAEDRKIMAQAGWERALQALDRVTPREQLDAARKGANMIRQAGTAEGGKKASEAEVRRPDGELRKESRAKVSTGVLAASKKDAARKEAAIKFATDTYSEFRAKLKDKHVDPTAPNAKENRAALKDAWDEIVKRNNGIDPTVRSKSQYVPLQQGEAHADAYQWLKALKASAKGQNHRNFATLNSVEGMGKESRATGLVEGDIAHRPQISEAGAEAETATGAMERSRTTFEHLDPDPRPNADNSYVEDHNKLADWINDRSPTEYQKLAEHYDLTTEMNEPADPAELMRDMKQTLADTGKRPKGELTTEVELPPKRVKAPTLPQKEETAAPGKVLDKNSDEFKKLAALYNEQAPKGPAKTKGEQLADLQAKREAATKAGHTIDTEAVDGTSEKAVRDQLMSFYKDESGAGFIHNLFSNTNPTSPAAAPAVTQYAETILPERLRTRMAEEKNLNVEIAANMAAATKKNSGVSDRDQRKIALAEQDNRINALPQELQDHYRKYTLPVAERAKQVLRDFKDLNDSEKLGHDIPNLNAVTTKAYQPRYQVDKQHFNRADTDAFDPFTGKGVGDWAPNLEDRKFFALENGPQRMVVEVTGDKDTGFGLNIHRAQGNVQVLKNIPAGFSGKLGEVLNLNVKGTKAKWTMDQATTKEIEGATGTKYYENATWAWSKMLHDITKAYENAKMEVEIKNDPRFAKLTTTDKEVAEKNGWSTKVSTHLPQFAEQNGKTLYMADPVRWVFDDYHKPGFGGNTSEAMEWARRMNTALFKVFNTNAPLVHVLNELDLFVVGRGLKWLSPTGYYNLAVAMPKAVKSVNRQDTLQAEMRNAGVNPMLASVGMRTMWETSAKNFGMEIIKHHSQWDPFAKAFGVSTKEIGQKLYDASSDVTWRLSDYLTTIRYLEEKAGGDFGAKPKTPTEAAKAVNKFMSDYHIGTTVMGSRVIQQLVTEQAVTGFGRYKAGVFRAFHHIGRDLLSKNATHRERLDAAAQLAIIGALGYVVYPAADALVRKVTGNEGGELRRRGVSSVVDAVTDIKTGAKDPAAFMQRAWTPAPLSNAALDIVKNRDFAGKQIMPQGEWPGVIPDVGAGLAEYAAKTIVPPYGTLSQHYARPEGTPGGALGAFAADQIGVALPSDAGNARKGRIEKINAQAEKARHKRPGGIIPDLMNRVTD